MLTRPTQFAARLAVCVLVPAALLSSAPASSAAAAVATRPAAYSAGPAVVTLGSTITIRAQAQQLRSGVWRATPRATATVWFDPDGARPNTAMRTIKADARGNLSTGFSASTSGVWTVRLAAAPGLASSSSAARRVTVTLPTSVRPGAGSWTCPSWAPIKGNATSRIYHLPSGRYYSRTKPEICFSSAAAAVRAGYRTSKV